MRTLEVFLCLAGEIILYSHRVFGWSMQRGQTTDVVLKALRIAMWLRKPTNRVTALRSGLSIHQHGDWTSFLKHRILGHQISQRRKCQDNSVAVRAFSPLKLWQTQRRNYKTITNAPDRICSAIKCSITRNASMRETEY